MMRARLTFLCLMSVALPALAAFTNGSDRLLVNENMELNQHLSSPDGRFRFNLQGDGNLVLRVVGSGQALWSSNTNGRGGVRLSMQPDGNLVLRSLSESAVWSSQTAGTGAVRLVMQSDANAVLSTSTGTVVWATGTTLPVVDTVRPVITLNGAATLSIAQGGVFTDQGATAADNVDGNITGRIVRTGSVSTGLPGTYTLTYNVSDSAGNAAIPVSRAVTVTALPVTAPRNGDNDGTASSTGQFSAPSAALYALNNAKQRVFPRPIDTGFAGNGHAETWDGRVFVRTRTEGWFASAFRPQRIALDSDGAPNFRSGAFGNSVPMELNADVTDMQHNWLAIVPDPAVTDENPYPSTANGTFSASGTHRTYKALMIHTSLRNGDSDQIGQRRATFIVSDGNTADAQVISARFTSPFAKYTVPSGADLRCIEPSVTIDGRLIVCQGHPNNDGAIDNLVYSWNSTPGATANWRAPKSIADMYHDDRDLSVAGVPFRVRYPMAERPLRDATGTAYARRELVKGAYPWISHDGSELFFQATRLNANNTGARRTGTSVVGRWTGWTSRHIDGPINSDRHATSKLFLSSPGAFTTMWIPYKDVADLKIPYSVSGPSYPIFGSNTRDYSEVAFDDYLDGNYVMVLGMNEQLARDGTYMKASTPDTSGRHNNGSLVGARFPLEFNSNDGLVGRVGQAIHFDPGNHINVSRTAGWDGLSEGFTVDFWVNKASGSGVVRLFTMQGGIEVYLANGSALTGAIQDTSGNRRQLNGPNIGSASWVHVAFSYNAFTKSQSLWVDGIRVASADVSGFGTLRTSGAVQVGPVNSTSSMLLDEVRVSNVARHAHEIAHSAFSRSHRAPDATLMAMVPSHLSALRNHATAVDRFSPAAADLGEALFNDVLLSKQRTTSCATCHQSNRAFTDGLVISRGNEPTDAGVRNTPSLLNRLFSTFQGWSGNPGSLDRQALVPIEAVHEMNLPIAEAIQRLSASATYRSRFQAVYGQAPNAENIAAALASFQATQFAPRNRVDQYLAGNRAVLSAQEARGLHLFEGKARCSGCHAGQNYTDESFRNNGLTASLDIGRADQTGRDRDFRLQKVPTLRELRSTGPYMHDGSINTLLDVVTVYNAGGLGDPMVDTDIRPLELSAQEILDLEAFLKALSANSPPQIANQFDLSGAWFEPSTAGQGLMIELYTSAARSGAAPYLFAGWFTYTDRVGGVAEHDWFALEGTGSVDGRVFPLTIGRPNASSFDNGAAAGAPVRLGTATLTFISCTDAVLDYQFNAAGGSRSGQVVLQRLLKNVSCDEVTPVANAPRGFLNSGAWYEPATAGQGFLFEVNPADRQLFGAWYTFSPGGPADYRWYTLQVGNVDAASTRISAVPVFETTGGRFDRNESTSIRQVGEATIDFTSCTSGQVSYRFTVGELAGRSGVIPLGRVGPAPTECQ